MSSAQHDGVYVESENSTAESFARKEEIMRTTELDLKNWTRLQKRGAREKKSGGCSLLGPLTSWEGSFALSQISSMTATTFVMSDEEKLKASVGRCDGEYFPRTWEAQKRTSHVPAHFTVSPYEYPGGHPSLGGFFFHLKNVKVAMRTRHFKAGKVWRGERVFQKFANAPSTRF